MSSSCSIYELPNEVFLAVITYLDIASVLAFRLTCRMIYQTAQDKVVWLQHLEEQAQTIPLAAGPVADLSAAEIQCRVLRGHRTDGLWLKNRRHPPRKFRAATNEHLLGVELLQDRYLLIIYAEAIYFWDLDAYSDRGESSLKLSREGLTSYIAVSDVERKRVLIAAKKHSFISPFVTVLYQIATESPHAITLICEMRTHSMHVPRYLDPASNLIFSSHACLVEILNWTGPDTNAVEVPTEDEALEEMYTTINTIRLFGPYMVVFKTRSIELHPLPTHLLPVIKHRFPNTYRSCAVSAISPGTFSVLACDLIQGLFHYIVAINLHPTYDVPALQVSLCGVHSLANVLYRQLPPSPLRMQEREGARVYHQQSSITSHSVQSRDEMNRGFVSAYAMGERGFRAIWMERKRETMLREVTAARLMLATEVQADARLEGEVVRDVEAAVVHAMHSVDLQEDLTHCALGEASGRIVLGNRAGDIYVMDIQ